MRLDEPCVLFLQNTAFIDQPVNDFFELHNRLVSHKNLIPFCQELDFSFFVIGNTVA